MRTGAWWLAIAALVGAAGCGGGGSGAGAQAPGAGVEDGGGGAAAAPSSSSSSTATPTATPTATATSTSTPTPTSAAAGDGGAATAAPSGGAKEKPYAKTSQEATSLIDDAITSKQAEIAKCVHAARERRKDPHGEVVVELGIDQEGSLIGTKTPKGQKEDKALLDCVRTALHDAPFPRSKAGVITVKRRFSDEVVYK